MVKGQYIQLRVENMIPKNASNNHQIGNNISTNLVAAAAFLGFSFLDFFFTVSLGTMSSKGLLRIFVEIILCIYSGRSS